MNSTVAFLRRYGYLNEAAPDIKGADFDVLEPTDAPCVGALKLYQEFFAEQLDGICQSVHHRGLIPDGKTGPATDHLMQAPRCGHPDFPVPEESDLYELYGVEEANWPPSCRDSLVTSRSFNSLPGMSREDTDGIWWASCHNWTESISDLMLTPGEIGDASPADFYAGLESMAGSTLAWSYLARNSCNVRLAQAYNSRVNWNKQLASATKTHEDGHALGLNHQNDPRATMYPSITNASMSRYGYPNATDISAMRSLGYEPHSDWENRRLPLDRLFLPRDSGDPSPEPPADLEERVKVLEEALLQGRVRDAVHDTMLEWHGRRLSALEK